MEEWTTLLNSSVFPMALTAYLVVRVENTLKGVTQALIKIDTKLGGSHE